MLNVKNVHCTRANAKNTVKRVGVPRICSASVLSNPTENGNAVSAIAIRLCLCLIRMLQFRVPPLGWEVCFGASALEEVVFNCRAFAMLARSFNINGSVLLIDANSMAKYDRMLAAR